MATVLEEYTAKEHRSLVRSCEQKNSMQRTFIKLYYMFMLRSVCRVKRLTIGSINSLKDFRKSQIMPNQVRNWLRQESKDFYAAGRRTGKAMGQVYQC
jgi:hypothetical protein